MRLSDSNKVRKPFDIMTYGVAVCIHTFLLYLIILFSSTAASKASDAVREKRNDIGTKENDLNGVNGKLGKDYGRDLEWMKLDNECFEKDEGE
jgi:hypothetical protein